MDVLIIDEAAMAGVRDLAAILTWAQQTGVDVRMIGDSKQLGSVAAGNTYRRRVEQLDGIRLRNNNRQLRSHERDAVTRLQAGDTFDGLAIFAAHGQVSVAMTDPERVTNTIAGWALDAARYPDPLQRVEAVRSLQSVATESTSSTTRPEHTRVAAGGSAPTPPTEHPADAASCTHLGIRSC